MSMLEKVDLFCEDKAFIQDLWRQELYPSANMLVLNNGFYCYFDLMSDERGARNLSWVPALSSGCIKENMCEGLAIMSEAHGGGLHVVGGECFSAGDDGFIALLNERHGSLIWLLTFMGTNPFAEISLDDHSVFARSTMGVGIEVPLTRPHDFVIVWP